MKIKKICIVRYVIFNWEVSVKNRGSPLFRLIFSLTVEPVQFRSE